MKFYLVNWHIQYIKKRLLNNEDLKKDFFDSPLHLECVKYYKKVLCNLKDNKHKIYVPHTENYYIKKDIKVIEDSKLYEDVNVEELLDKDIEFLKK